MNILRIKIILTLVVLAISFSVAAQVNDADSKNPYKGLPFKERIFFGGDLGLSFGSITYIRLAPRLGYRVNPRFSIGTGPTYQYYSDNRYLPKYTSSIYGGSVFGQYFIFESVFLQAELEVLNLDSRFPKIVGIDELAYDRVTIPVLFVGGGYSERSPNGSGFFIGIFYDVIQDPNSPYNGNIAFRVGGYLGL